MELDALENNSYYILLAFIIFLPILLSFIKRRKLHLPPGPYAWPVVGNFFDLDGKKPHISLTNLSQSFGPLISLRFGSRLVIVASTPNAAKEVFKFHDRELSGRAKLQIAKKILTKDSSMIATATSCDQNWKEMRGMSHTELFSSHALESKSNVRTHEVGEMLKFLNNKDGKEVVCIADIVFVTLVNSLSMAMVSREVTSWEKVEEMKNNIRTVIKLGIPGLGDIYPALAGLFYFDGEKKLRDYLEICEVLWGKTVRDRRGKNNVGDCQLGGDFLDVLVKNSWEDNKIYSLLMEFMVSTQTMTTTIEWAMAELIRHPKALSKLQNEIDAAAAKSPALPLTDHQLTKLVYLQAVIKEIFRLHPPSPFLVPRAAIQNCKLMNYDIPKDSIVLVNFYAMGRDSKTWEDPTRFNPDRFIDSGLDLKGTDYELLPFGSGRRICAGLPMALKEIQMVIASLVYAFDWSLPSEITHPSNIDMSEKFDIVLGMEEPLKLIPKRRI